MEQLVQENQVGLMPIPLVRQGGIGIPVADDHLAGQQGRPDDLFDDLLRVVTP